TVLQGRQLRTYRILWWTSIAISVAGRLMLIITAQVALAGHIPSGVKLDTLYRSYHVPLFAGYTLAEITSGVYLIRNFRDVLRTSRSVQSRTMVFRHLLASTQFRLVLLAGLCIARLIIFVIPLDHRVKTLRVAQDVDMGLVQMETIFPL